MSELFRRWNSPAASQLPARCQRLDDGTDHPVRGRGYSSCRPRSLIDSGPLPGLEMGGHCSAVGPAPSFPALLPGSGSRSTRVLHRRPGPGCVCRHSRRLPVEPRLATRDPGALARLARAGRVSDPLERRLPGTGPHAPHGNNQFSSHSLGSVSAGFRYAVQVGDALSATLTRLESMCRHGLAACSFSSSLPRILAGPIESSRAAAPTSFWAAACDSSLESADERV